MSGKENAKSCSGLLMIFFGIALLLALGTVVLGYVFERESFDSEFMNPDSDGTNINYVIFLIVGLVIAVVVFSATGGKNDQITGKDR